MTVRISPISSNDVNHRGSYTGQADKAKFMPWSLTHHSEGKTIRLQTQVGKYEGMQEQENLRGVNDELMRTHVAEFCKKEN